MECPSCKSHDLAPKGSFRSQAEPVGESPSAVVVVEMLTCNGCQLEFPSLRGGRRYTLVTSTSFSNLLKERGELEEKQATATIRLNELDTKWRDVQTEIARIE